MKSKTDRYRIAPLLLGLGLTSAALGQQQSAYQQGQHFIEQLSVHNGVLAWSGLGVGTTLADVERQWGSPIKLTRSSDDTAHRFGSVAKGDVTVRLSFATEDGPSYLDEACLGKTDLLNTTEVEALKRRALKRLSGLERPVQGAPPDEPLQTESSELAIDPQGICVRVGASY